MNCLWLSKWKKKKNTGCEVCCMGFHYIGANRSLTTVKMVNQGLILSPLEPPCMLNQS